MGELFSGAGGLGVGFVTANHPSIRFSPIFAIDNDNLALQSYRKNLTWLTQNAHKETASVKAYRGDVSKLHTDNMRRILGLRNQELDLLTGGPPCQGYSSSNRASKQKSKDDRNNLTAAFLTKVHELQPKMFLLENVQGVKWTEPTTDMRANWTQLPLLNDAEADSGLGSVEQFLVHRSQTLGYKVWYGIIDAADFGVPQHRMRFFLFGVRSDLIPVNVKVSLDGFLAPHRIARHVTVGQAIGDLPEIKNGEAYAGEYQPSFDTYVQKMREYMSNNVLYDHFTTKHQDYVIERYKHILQGKNWESVKELMTTYTKIEKTHSNIYRRLCEDLPANTITHYRKSMVIHPTQDRGLSFREACRLQSFPDWFRFEGGSEAMQQQLANAVPPLLAQKVALAIAGFWNTLQTSNKLQLPATA